MTITSKRMYAIAITAVLIAGPALAAPAQQRVPPGTRATLTLSGWLSSADAKPGDTFEATLAEDVTVEGATVVPAGAVFTGRVVEVEHARKASRGGKIVLVIDRLVSGDGESASAPGTVTAVEEGSLEGEGEKGKSAGVGAVIGGIVGAVLGGGKGLLIGAAAGAGGGIIANRGEDVQLPEGTRLLVKFDQEVRVTWTWRPQG